MQVWRQGEEEVVVGGVGDHYPPPHTAQSLGEVWVVAVGVSTTVGAGGKWTAGLPRVLGGAWEEGGQV